MKKSNIERASLAQLRAMKDRGELTHQPGPGFSEELPPGFWDDAEIVPPPTRSIHLKVDADVLDFFKAQGKGHLTRMQNVLRAYVRAEKRRRGG